jgi:hypothetical protein
MTWIYQNYTYFILCLIKLKIIVQSIDTSWTKYRQKKNMTYKYISLRKNIDMEISVHITFLE